jgi:hypothetical protein
MNTEVALGVVAVAGTLTAGLGSVWLQARNEHRRWRRERRAALYIDLVAEAMQRRKHAIEWANHDPYQDPHGPAFTRQWSLMSESDMLRKSAEIRVFGEPQMQKAWERYVQLHEREHADWALNGELPSEAERQEFLDAIDDVLAAGERHGV